MSHWIMTGGAGYIGSRVVAALLGSRRSVTAVDDLSTGLRDRVDARADFVPMSVLDWKRLRRLLVSTRAAGVVHLAGKKSPAESVYDPLLYARENAGGVVALASAAHAAGTPAIVFSSSCSVYGTPATEAVDERCPTAPESPYGESKLYGEKVLDAVSRAHGLGVISLRYFNVVGAARPSMGDTGAFNLVPRVFAALRRGERPTVFGNDYPTVDGTCVRDYVDVEDLADAHVRSALALENHPGRSAVYNIGRGEGSSVLEVLDMVSEVSRIPTSPVFASRRPGDPASVVAAVDSIRRDFGWSARRDLRSMVGSAWAASRHT